MWYVFAHQPPSTLAGITDCVLTKHFPLRSDRIQNPQFILQAAPPPQVESASGINFKNIKLKEVNYALYMA